MRQEAGEQEGVVGQAGADQCGKRRGGAGQGDDAKASLDSQRREAIAGIGNQRRPGVGDEGHGFSLREEGEQARPGLVGIVFVIGEGPVANAVAVEQYAGDAGVLAGEHVGSGKRFQRTQGDIGEIADGRGDEIERRLQRPGGYGNVMQAVAARMAPAVLVMPVHARAAFLFRSVAVYGPCGCVCTRRFSGSRLWNWPNVGGQDAIGLAIALKTLPFCPSIFPASGRAVNVRLPGVSGHGAGRKR